MEETKLLEAVKNGAGKLSEYHDDVIKVWIREVKEFLLSAGIPKSVLESEKSAGIITRGVLDLWNYGAGDGKLSDYFLQRAIQLQSEEENKDV